MISKYIVAFALVAVASTATAEILGSADGKEYHGYTDRTMNWFDAKNYCESNLMRIASINTKAQADVLINYLKGNSKVQFWTAARESLTQYSFVWDTTQTYADMNLFREWTGFPYKNNYCGFLSYSSLHNQLSMNTKTCSSRHPVLCEDDI